jgi:hypothetical protein
MEKGSQALARMIGISLLLGVAVLLLHPGYRQTAAAFWKGGVDSSPIAVSNRDYYPDITWERRAAPDEK